LVGFVDLWVVYWFASLLAFPRPFSPPLFSPAKQAARMRGLPADEPKNYAAPQGRQSCTYIYMSEF
jgi:hypothetical protein